MCIKEILHKIAQNLAKQQGQYMNRNDNTSRRCLWGKKKNKTVMIPRPTLSNVPAAEEPALGNSPSFEDDNTSTYISINDENDEFSEGVSDKHQSKKYLGTKI